MAGCAWLSGLTRVKRERGGFARDEPDREHYRDCRTDQRGAKPDAGNPQQRREHTGRSIRGLAYRREKLAIALRTDRAVNQLAGGGRLKLSAFPALLFAIGLVLVCDRRFGYLYYRIRSVRLPAEDRRRTGGTCGTP
jgi:hypothetical protein